eukprot:TRINITY_DN3254_c0_g1_i1.p1 TRINITY_DN3254_c0_g1~~TRINITY_DN3254_c0_g1_i1.p1  ORF type:complete len:196 (-),score=34.83 TRINITY_DN3254_c0_g1_i1:172-759(-)
MQLKVVALLILQIGVSIQHWCGYQPSLRLVNEDRNLIASNDKTLTYVKREINDYDYGNDDSSLISGYNVPQLDSFFDGLNLETGIFTAPATRTYKVTLTAILTNLGYEDTAGSLSSYAQLFILQNGHLYSLDNYLLVEHNKVGDLRLEVDMQKGDTLQVFVGHHVNDKTRAKRNGYGGFETVQCFNLEQVRFCIF